MAETLPTGNNRGSYGKGWHRVLFNGRLRVWRVHLPSGGRKRRAWAVGLDTGHVLLWGYRTQRMAKYAMHDLVRVTDWFRTTHELRNDKGLWREVAQRGSDDGVMFCGKDGEWIQGNSKLFEKELESEEPEADN